MPRSARVELAGGLHHVTARAPKGLRFFHVRSDAVIYLSMLSEVTRDRGWSVRTYCLMPNHVHFLIMTPEANLSDGMKVLHERFVPLMHERRGSHGHLLGDRYKNRHVRSENHEIACFRYIARNPVAAGLCATPAEWEWSAHRALIGDALAPPFLDLDAAHQVIHPKVYRDLAEIPDAGLMQRLAAQKPNTWIAEAVDDYGVPVTHVAEHLGVCRATTYNRLRAARDNR